MHIIIQNSSFNKNKLEWERDKIFLLLNKDFKTYDKKLLILNFIF